MRALLAVYKRIASEFPPNDLLGAELADAAAYLLSLVDPLTTAPELRLQRPVAGKLEDCTPAEFRAFAQEMIDHVDIRSDSDAWVIVILAKRAMSLLSLVEAQAQELGLTRERLDELNQPDVPLFDFVPSLVTRLYRDIDAQAQEIARLREAHGWQPIETAITGIRHPPFRALLWHPQWKYPKVGVVNCGEWLAEMNIVQPTHWMPLPAAPTVAKEPRPTTPPRPCGVCLGQGRKNYAGHHNSRGPMETCSNCNGTGLEPCTVAKEQP
jgi:hypothetical protein